MLEYLNEVVNSTVVSTETVLLRMFVSFILGGMIGLERQYRRREAGLRTFTLISIGSTAAMLISIWIPQSYPDFLNGDPGRIAAQVLSGIGFLGAGAIIQGRGSIHGLTTAACIWVVAVIGLQAGAGMLLPASITAVVSVFVLMSVEQLEKKMFLYGSNKILSIHFSTASPDLSQVRCLLENNGIYIVNASLESLYDKGESVVTYKVNVRKVTSSYKQLFDELYRTGFVSQIKLVA